MGSFSILLSCRSFNASGRETPTGAVTSGLAVITSRTARVWSDSKRMSRLVTMPSSRPSPKVSPRAASFSGRSRAILSIRFVKNSVYAGVRDSVGDVRDDAPLDPFADDPADPAGSLDDDDEPAPLTTDEREEVLADL